MERLKPSTTLVIATTNRGKLVEFRALLAATGLEVVGILDVLPQPPPIVEDAPTFAGNAMKKATLVAAASGRLTLADDSGLEVDALQGRPGVRSARFAHEHATDPENNAALLNALGGVPVGERTARFRCALALVDPRGATTTAEGVCDGSIALDPRGGRGFGYDPLFIVGGDTRTMAELTQSEKNAVSHRARALRELLRALE
jgi:XTP/dITP diphosphohydrolase